MEKEGFHRPTWVEIDLDAIAHNIEEIKKLIKNKRKIMGVVKADAYGHGAVEVAKTLLMHGVEYLAVAMVDEALVLRKAGVDCPILVLGYTPEQQVNELIKWDITQTIYSENMVDFIHKVAVLQNKIVKVHIKVDTGMGRIGFKSKDEILKILRKIGNLPKLEVQGIFTHFATADEEDKSFAQNQLKTFRDICNFLEKENIHIPIKHIANSAAIIDMEDTYFNMVRPGIILYGLYPSEEVFKEKISLKPSMTFKTKIVHIKKIDKDTSIGYGRKYIAPEERRIATLPVGYADGYSRMLSGKAEVLAQGKKVPVVGNICMDQCMIDITNHPKVQMGDEVTLFGQGMTVEEVAQKLGTINYEVLCMVNKRVPRVYIKNKEIMKISNTLID
ncbi:alanine racemase [Irregularibacter muris]|uniref:Alanine racemase n=1 Tax=Irregularibacter muris TaxID=1796619 RepID=A0AAE3KZC1_9FIRM|nr:alanine racemase [Irregularibacter muris]MCR1898501.1 alanine racemase [Irregularibacter muris]